jgi:hypothetical protein
MEGHTHVFKSLETDPQYSKHSTKSVHAERKSVGLVGPQQKVGLDGKIQLHFLIGNHNLGG